MLRPALLLVALALPTTFLCTSRQDVDWRTDLSSSIAEAERDGRPLLIVFR